MTNKVMTDDRLRELIATYGADPLNYPENEREAAEARLFEAPDLFLALLAEARLVDDALREVPDADVSRSLRNTLIDSGPAAPRMRGWSWRGFQFPVWAPAGAFASIALGLLVGLNIGTQSEYLDEDEEAEAYVYAALGYGFLEILEDAEE